MMDKKLRYFLYLAALCLLTACVAVREAPLGEASQRDWPIFRGSASLSGYTDCSLPDSPKLLWSKSAQSRTVASPIVFGGTVFMMNRRGELRGYTLEGDSCAYYNLNTTVEASFVASDTTLYIGRIDGFITALSIKQLLKPRPAAQRIRPLWEYETLGQISGSPNLVGDNLLVGSYDNSMYTFQAQTGRKTGQFETGYYINGAAAVCHRYMTFGGCDSWVRVVDVTTGEMTDSLELDSYVPASPAILESSGSDDGFVACACDYNGNVYEMQVDLSSTSGTMGKIKNHRKLYATTDDNENQSGGVVSMPTLTPDAVYVLSDDRYVSCIDRQGGKVRWRKMLRGMTGECSPLVAQDKLLVCTKDGHVSIHDTQTGTELWHYETGEQIIASPAIISDRFFILTSRGTLLCFN